MPVIGTKAAASSQGFGEFGMVASGGTPQTASAIDYDGSTDFLYRTFDLAGNNNSGTFTFSAWVWSPTNPAGYIYAVDNTYFRVHIAQDVSTLKPILRVTGQNSSGIYVLAVDTVVELPLNTWFNILVSIDMSNTANRAIYINDALVPATWSTYTTGSSISFARSGHCVAASTTASADYRGRLSNVFLDYTYRDLSIAANRRLFITADLKPAAGQAALNPILYLPMNDPTAPGTNAGTGGNFLLNGVVARSGRGPNEYNAPYSTFNGTSDQTNHGNFPTATDYSKLLTIAFTFKASASLSTGPYIIRMTTVFGSVAISVRVGSSYIGIFCQDTTGTEIINGLASLTPTIGRNYNVVISLDLSNTAKRHIAVNGVLTGTWNTYNTAGSIGPHTGGITMYVGGNLSFFPGQIGGLYYAQAYIDLTVAANLAKFVTGTGIDAKPMDLGATGELPTGTSALVYLPLYGNAVGKNYGSGGDFNMPTLPGARGPNEFWGNKATLASGAYLSKNTGVGFTSGKIISLSFWFQHDVASTGTDLFAMQTSLGGYRFRISQLSSDQLSVDGWNSSGVQVLRVESTLSLFTSITHVCINIDLSNTSNRSFYINGVANSASWYTYTNTDMDFSSAPYTSFAGAWSGSAWSSMTLNGRLAEFYMTTTYIDFSQEANRLKFRDCFGNPTDLPSAITAGTVPNPAIYMRFPPTSFGANSGTGGNFTVNGTITDGGQL